MKKIILTALMAATTMMLWAQDYKKLFIAENGSEVTTLDSATVIREIRPPSQADIVNFEDYYKNTGKIKMKGSGYYYKDSFKFHGDFVLYDFNGRKSSELRFENGRNVGMISEYFKNEKLSRKYEMVHIVDQWDFDKTAAMSNEISNAGYEIKRLNYVADSVGNVLLQNGNGIIEEKVNYIGEEFVEKGVYKNGFREGWWIGTNSDNSKVFKDFYKKGVFRRGKWEQGGNGKNYGLLYLGSKYRYHNNHITHFYLHDNGFYNNYKPGLKKGSYPHGDYYIEVTVNLNENGKVESVEIDSSLKNEKVRRHLTEMLMAMPAWKPAQLRGVAVSSSFVCGIPVFKSME